MKVNKKNNITRFLAILSLLIFFLPFFQMFSDKNIKESGLIRSYTNAKTQQEKEIAFQQSKEDFSLSGYELAMSFESGLLGFTAIMFLNITIVICIFRKHKIVFLLSFLNLLIIISSFVAIALMLLGLAQIRYGMFLCLVNSLLLFYFLYREQEEVY